MRVARVRDPDPVAFRRALEAARGYDRKLVFGAVLHPFGSNLGLRLYGDDGRHLASLDAVTGAPLR